jgi:hypothetical protein
MDALHEADRLMKGIVADEVAQCIDNIRTIMDSVDREQVHLLSYRLGELPYKLVPYLESPFAQALAFNHFCIQEGLSHTRGSKKWEGGNAAVSCRNLVFLPPIFGGLFGEGLLDKTRLANIANRNLNEKGYADIANMVRTRRKEDLDETLLHLPADYLKVGRRGPVQALEAAVTNGWMDRYEEVQVAEDLVQESGVTAYNEGGEEKKEKEAEWQIAIRHLRAGLQGSNVLDGVADGLKLSPDPQTLVEQFLTAHRQSGDPDPEEVGKTLFFAHAGPIERIDADDKFLLRHFRPVKTQKRGQLFYRILEVIEEILMERQHLDDLESRGIEENGATGAVQSILDELNKDPNHYLLVPEEWLGEVTRRHLYFGSRTRKEGSAYKWFRKIGTKYYLGGHKTVEELAEKEDRKRVKAEAKAAK